MYYQCYTHIDFRNDETLVDTVSQALGQYVSLQSKSEKIFREGESEFILTDSQ